VAWLLNDTNAWSFILDFDCGVSAGVIVLANLLPCLAVNALGFSFVPHSLAQSHVFSTRIIALLFIYTTRTSGQEKDNAVPSTMQCHLAISGPWL
jgi:hypothetical protein